MHNRQITLPDFKLIDFIPALSGLIGKTALVTSFAFVWAQELHITNPDFVFENVRIEMIIASLITLIVALLLPNTSPSGTLAPLIVLIPVMARYGVHPLILSITVGLFGILSIKTKIFHKLINLSGNISKTSLTLTFGVSGVLLSLKNLYRFFEDKYTPFILLLFVLLVTYFLLRKWNKAWLVIPIAAIVSVVISIAFGVSFENRPPVSFPSFNPFYWWNDMWGIGFGFKFLTIMKTIPFALFVILLWAIDTISINAMLDANYKANEKREEINLDRSFIVTSLRNIIGGICGGSQTSALWRSFLIPLFMVKRPLRSSSILLGILGVIAGFFAIPIQILSFPPLIWSVLLFGIFLPFILVGISNLNKANTGTQKSVILFFTCTGVLISPIITWMGAIIYEKLIQKYIHTS